MWLYSKKVWVNLIWILSFAIFGCSKKDGLENNTISSKQEQKSFLGYSSKITEINGLSFHYVEAGSGPLILFLHGFPYFAESWDPLLKPLSEKNRVIAPDNRGYGYTEKPSQVNDYKIEYLVADVTAFISKFANNKPVILVGHDWGGVLAWSVAQKHPQLVNKVIAINAPPFNVFLNMLAHSDSQKEASSYIDKLTSWVGKLYFYLKGPELMWGSSMQRLHEKGHVNDEFKRAFLVAWSQKGAAEAAVNWYKANIPAFDEINDDSYLQDKNTRIQVPSLLIWSKNDKAFSFDTFQAIPRYVDNLEINVIDTTSHTPQFDHTAEVLTAIKMFIDSPS